MAIQDDRNQCCMDIRLLENNEFKEKATRRPPISSVFLNLCYRAQTSLALFPITHCAL